MEVLTTYNSSHGCRSLVRCAPQPPALCVPVRVVLAIARPLPMVVRSIPRCSAKGRGYAPTPTSLRSVPARGRGCELSRTKTITYDDSGTSTAMLGVERRLLLFPNLYAEEDLQFARLPFRNSGGHSWTPMHSDSDAKRYSRSLVLIRMSGRPRGFLVRRRSGDRQEKPLAANHDDARFADAGDHRLTSGRTRLTESRLETTPDRETAGQVVLRR